MVSMDKKIILLISCIFISTGIALIILVGENPTGPGRISIEETKFREEINYIDVDTKLLKQFGLEKGFRNADSYFSIDPETGREGGIAHTTVVPLNNNATKTLELFLIESNQQKTRDNHYYLKFENKSFWVGIYYCEPDCPHFIEGEIVE